MLYKISTVVVHNMQDILTVKEMVNGISCHISDWSDYSVLELFLKH